MKTQNDFKLGQLWD